MDELSETRQSPARWQPQLRSPAENPHPYGWTVGLLALASVIALCCSPLENANPQVMRFVHSLSEALVIMFCATIFALAWNTRLPEASGRIEVTGLLFLAAGLLSFLHLMSFQPFAFVEPGGTSSQRAHFGVAARALMVATLVWTSLQPVFPGLSGRTRRLALAALLFVFGLLFYLTVWGQAQLDILSSTEPMPLYYRRITELVIGAAAAFACWQFLRRFEGLTAPIRLQLACAAAVLGLASLSFGMAPPAHDLSSLLAHGAKLLACFLVYRAVVEGSIIYPRNRILRLNNALADSEERWRLAIDAGSHAVFEWQFAPDSIRLSGSRVSSLALDIEALRRSGTRALLRHVHAEDQQVLSATLDAASRGESDSIQCSFRLIAPSVVECSDRVAGNPAQLDHGMCRWLELRAARVTHHAPQKGMMIGSLTDVSEQQRSLERLAQSQATLNGIIESAMDAIITIDADFRIVLFNQAAEHIFRCKTAEVIGGTLDRFLPLRHRGSHDEHVRNFGLTGISQRRMGFSILPALRADGTEFPISAAISQVRVADRSLYTVILRDVSEQVASERAVVQSQRELAELSLRAHHALEDERRRVARELHDDFGQSLTAMRMEVGLARQSAANGHAAIDEHCTRMDSLIAAMVASTRRISSDLRPLVLDDLGLGAAIDWLVERFSEQHRIAADVYVDEEVAHLAEPHASALFRIVQESLTNVARHSGASAVEVRIESLGEQIHATVWDNGRGIAAGSIEQRNTFGLRGLRERAQLLGGNFEIFSRMGEGTTIRVSLPRPQHAPPAH